MNDGMNVAKIAAAPILRMIGMRFPNSAHVNPPIDSRTIAIKMSEGTVPVAENPAITASRTRKTGSGTMPILKSTIDHQPFGHQPSVPLRPAVATLLISCTEFLPISTISFGKSSAYHLCEHCRFSEYLFPMIAGTGAAFPDGNAKCLLRMNSEELRTSKTSPL